MVIKREERRGYINATSTCDCGLRAEFACESELLLSYARAKVAPKQRFIAQAIVFIKLLESFIFGLIT